MRFILSRMIAGIALMISSCRVALACPKTALGFCSGHGNCDILKCSCYSGFEGPACDFRKCPSGKAWQDLASGIDSAHKEAVCSNRGLCDTLTGKCACQLGFEGKSCQRQACPLKCSGRGSCVSMKRLAQLKYDTVKYETPWDSDKSFGCLCDRGYKGYDCSLIECAVGDDPASMNQVNEKQLIQCKKTSGKFYIKFDGASTNAISYADTISTAAQKMVAMTTLGGTGKVERATIQLKSHHTITTTGSTGVCDVNGNLAIEVEFKQAYGNLEALRIFDENGEPLAGTTLDETRVYCVSDSLYFTCPESSISASQICPTNPGAGTCADALTAVAGTRESKVCSGRGICEATGVCTCSGAGPDYVSSNGLDTIATTGRKGSAYYGGRGDCGAMHADMSLFKCIGEVPCSGHGHCSNAPSFVCSCFAGWQAADCSEMTCPLGKAWFGAPTANNEGHAIAECSNKGICDRSLGACTCFAGYEGAACDMMSCPTSAETAEASVQCSGHGNCLHMQSLAPRKTENGVETAYTYGLVPNDPLRWDAENIYGCDCDNGWYGIDCAKQYCPFGDNPSTGGLPEIQHVTFTPGGPIAVSDTVQLKFRQATATLLAADTAAEVKTKLMALGTVSTLTVEIVDPGNAAAPALLTAGGATTLRLTFQDNFGDLPPIQPILGTANTTAVVTTIFDGTFEDAECSEKGVCDPVLGSCICRVGWGSSDRKGGEGAFQDCGYRTPFLPAAG